MGLLKPLENSFGPKLSQLDPLVAYAPPQDLMTMAGVDTYKPVLIDAPAPPSGPKAPDPPGIDLDAVQAGLSMMGSKGGTQFGAVSRSPGYQKRDWTYQPYGAGGPFGAPNPFFSSGRG